MQKGRRKEGRNAVKSLRWKFEFRMGGEVK